MPQVVAVAGGTGGLGRALVEVLQKDSRYEPLILARDAKPELEKELGVRILAADYSNVDSLVDIFESNNVWAVLSVMHTFDKTPEANLIQAADRSSTTKRFVPNIWSGFTFLPEHDQILPYVGLKFAAIDALKKTSLEWTQIYTGLFLDYFIVNHPSHVKPPFLLVDVHNDVATIPGTGNDPIHFTYTFDVAKYTAALLAFDAWEQNYYVVGDVKSWNELVEIIERAKGVKFGVNYSPVEMLKRDEMYSVPDKSGEKTAGMLPDRMAKSGLWFTQGLAAKREGVCLNELVEEVNPLTFEAAWGKTPSP